ncbi:MAG TPA: hypothetical protein VHN14_08600 [Kofleriaceae bacterium]|nr:hypothetical protein [Kofleriaceae bacterium]
MTEQKTDVELDGSEWFGALKDDVSVARPAMNEQDPFLWIDDPVVRYLRGV